MKKTGVYKIKNTKNGDFYVGAAKNIRLRAKVHRKLLRNGTHNNSKLLSAWRTHGAESFEFTPLLYCSEADLLYFEQLCIAGLNPQYNQVRPAGDGAWRYDDDLRQKISNATKAATLIPSEKRDAWRLRQKSDPPRAKKYTHAGETLTLKEWGKKLGVSAQALYGRIHNQGWPLSEALTTGKVSGARPDTYDFRGERRSATEIATALGVSDTLVRKRIAAGETPDQIEAAVAAKRFTLDGVTDTATGWGRRLGCSGEAVANRLRRAENHEECLRKLRDEGVQPARRPRGKHIDAEQLERLLAYAVVPLPKSR